MANTQKIEQEIYKLLFNSLGYDDQEEFDEDTVDLREELLSLYKDYLEVEEQKLKPSSSDSVSNEAEKKQSKNQEKKKSEEKKKTTSLLEFKKEKLEEDDSLTSAQLKAMWKAVDASEKKQYAEIAKEINKKNGF